MDLLFEPVWVVFCHMLDFTSDYCSTHAFEAATVHFAKPAVAANSLIAKLSFRLLLYWFLYPRAHDNMVVSRPVFESICLEEEVPREGDDD